MQPTSDQFKAWIKGQRHPFYETSVTYYDDLRVHALGEYPDKLINERRPQESKTIQDYRKKIYVSPTQGVYKKVENSLMKIRKATDYTIEFNSKDIPTSIGEKDTLQYYTTSDFPKYQSLDNWFWSVCFPQMLIDSNAVSIVMPMTYDVPENEYIKPYPTIFNSNQIWDYVEDQYYFVKSNEITYYKTGNRTMEGCIYYYIDQESIIKYTQVGSDRYDIFEYLHGLNDLPVVKLHGNVERDNVWNTLYRSKLHAMLPSLKECVREYSDLQAAVVQSMFPTYWYIQSQKCASCQGVGKIPNKSGASTACKQCGGKGEFPFNPFEHSQINVKQSELGANPAITPPGGIIEKDTKVITIQNERIQQHKFEALKAVNMEHLDNAPLNQSGLAKEWDRSEGNNFVYSFAEDAVRVLDEHFEYINHYRYLLVVPNEEDREAMKPKINVPVKFDIATDAAIAQDISRMKDAKFNQATIAAAEVEFVGRKFVTDPALRDLVVAMYELDPLAGKASDDIIQESAQGWISKESGVIHSNIKEFINRAMNEDPNFLGLTDTEKKAKMLQYATEFITSNSSAGKVISMIQPNATANNQQATQGN